MDRLCLFGANIDVYRTNGTNCIGHWVYGSGFYSETFFTMHLKSGLANLRTLCFFVGHG